MSFDEVEVYIVLFLALYVVAALLVHIATRNMLLYECQVARIKSLRINPVFLFVCSCEVIDGYGTVAFVFGSVSTNSGAGIPDAAIDRKEFERLAAAYFAEHPELADCAVHADQASILVISGSRAIIRHHVNALGVCGLDLRP